jgi:hypothetical protein
MDYIAADPVGEHTRAAHAFRRRRNFHSVRETPLSEINLAYSAIDGRLWRKV